MTEIDYNKISIFQCKIKDYPLISPFNPPEYYPEYPFLDSGLDDKNSLYEDIRQLFYLLGLDKSNFGSEKWNPLGEIISPGNKVLIKPNFVLDRHPLGGDINSIITHGSILRPVIDYVIIALKGKGEIIVADAPLSDTDFEVTTEINGVKTMINFYKQRKINIKLLDLRAERTIATNDFFVFQRIKLNGDPEGYFKINLGKDSELYELKTFAKRYRGSDYNADETFIHHNDDINEYLIAATAIKADVIISVPKLKTHCKVGTTLNLKNMIGINGDKNWIPHYRIGSPKNGGDEFHKNVFLLNMESKLKDRIKCFVYKTNNKTILSLISKFRRLKRISAELSDNPAIPSVRGSWYGNDTIWRSTIDINKILFYADKNGNMCSQKQKKYFSIIDGIVAGEADGPLFPRAKKLGLILSGFNPVSVDAYASFLMGFDYNKINLINKAVSLKKYNFGELNPEIFIESNIPEWIGKFIDKTEPNFNFIAPTGWKNHIER